MKRRRFLHSQLSGCPKGPFYSPSYLDPVKKDVRVHSTVHPTGGLCVDDAAVFTQFALPEHWTPVVVGLWRDTSPLFPASFLENMSASVKVLKP